MSDVDQLMVRTSPFTSSTSSTSLTTHHDINTLHFPHFFVESCSRFFNIQTSCNIDSYWGVSLHQIAEGLYKAFDKDIEQFLPGLNTNQLPFFEYATLLHEQSTSKTSILPMTEEVNQTKSGADDVKTIDFSECTYPVPLVGFIGEMGHGKSTAAEFLCQNFGYVEYSFARPLKEGVKILFSLSDSQVYTEQKNEVDPRWNISPRVMLQKLGTELFREKLSEYLPQLSNIHSTLWIANFLRWFRDHQNSRVVVSDCRFQDEAACLKDCNFVLIRMVRPTHAVPHATPTFPQHASESVQKIIQVDDTIINDGTLHDLYLRVKHRLLTQKVEHT